MTVGGVDGGGSSSKDAQSTSVAPQSAPSTDLLAEMQNRLWRFHFDSKLCEQLDVGVNKGTQFKRATLNVHF